MLTYRTFLMYKASATTDWAQLVPITNYPDYGGTPERVEITNLQQKRRSYEEGLEDVDEQVFTANYTKADYAKIKALAGQELEFATWFGGTGDGESAIPTGEDGKFPVRGKISVKTNGGGIGEARTMDITITVSEYLEDDSESGD